MIQNNIKKLKSKLKELENHPCCFDYEFDNSQRLIIFLPEGYYYNNYAQALRLNESSKIKNIEKAIPILEKIWDDSCFWK